MVEQPEVARRSFRALGIALVGMFLVLVAGLFNMQVLHGSTYKAQAEENRERVVIKKASRGVVYDRSGAQLVTNNPSYSLAVSPADLVGFNCVTRQFVTSTVFVELAKIVDSKNVVALRPDDMPKEKIGEVANRLSVLFQVPADTLREPLKQTIEASPTSKNLFVLRKDLTNDVAARVRAELKNLPGVYVYNELEYNFLTRFDKCLKPVIIQRGVRFPEEVQNIEAARGRLPGVSVVTEPVRHYEKGPLFGHIMGYIGPISREQYEGVQDVYEPDDKVGQTGIEAALEGQLRGKKGASSVIVNSKEQIVTEIASQAPITGNNVTLSIDAALQEQVAIALQDGITKAKVQAGSAVVMRVDNGQVLAMVSLPSYDDNLFAAGISQANFDRLNNDRTLPMFDRAVGGAYPPGSTYKMITAAAALQEGVVSPATQVYCPGFIEVPYTWSEQTRNPFRDWKQQGHGVLNIVQALTVSSDVFFYIMAGPRQEDRRIKKEDGTEEVVWTRYYVPNAKKPTEFNGLGIEKLGKYADAFGLGHKTGIELPGEVSGIAPDPLWKVNTFPENQWSLGDTLVTAIGQGYNVVTPLQLANVTATIANGGTRYQPQVVLKVNDWAGNTVTDFQPKVLGQVPVSQENLALVREGMRQAVAAEKGTAHNRITLKSIPIAGKTGTAEYGDIIAIKDGKEIRKSHAWFTAFAPYDKPEIAVVVLLEGGIESLEGSTFAVPVTDAILKAYFKVDK
jgi:penicillin-binding protein 2